MFSITNYFEKIKKTNQGYIFLIINSLLTSFAFSFIPFFFHEKGYPDYMIIFMVAAYTGLCILVNIFLETFYPKQFIRAGFIIQAILFLSLAFYNQYTYYSMILFGALNIVFYWISFNYIFFKKTTRKDNATNSSWYILIPGFIGMFMPALAAFVINNYGFRWQFLSAVFVYVLAIIFTWNVLDDERVVVKTKDSVKKFKGLKSMAIFEGSFQFFNGWVIPIMSLVYLKTGSDFGFFLSYLAIVSLIVSLIIARKSDVDQKRKWSTYSLFSLSILAIISLIFVKTALMWIIIVGVFVSLYNISWPLRMAIFLDSRQPDLAFWKAWELFLNIGRVITLTIAGILLYFQIYYAIFLMYALLLIGYIFLIEYKMKDLK